jgi:hypothetical protein
VTRAAAFTAALLAPALALAPACGGASRKEARPAHGRFAGARVAVAPDGSLVVAGIRSVARRQTACGRKGGGRDLVVVRLSSTGARTNVASVTKEAMGGCANEPGAVLLQPGGRGVIVSEWAYYRSSDVEDDNSAQVPVIARLRGDRLDRSFGDNGVIGTGQPSSDLAALPDGSLVSGAGTRYDANGTEDPDFRLPGPSDGVVAAVPGGGLVLVALRAYTRLVLYGYRREGVRDLRFGSRGAATTTVWPEPADFGQLDGLAATRHGTYVLTEVMPHTPNDRLTIYMLYRFRRDGRLDARFGTHGRVVLRQTRPHGLIDANAVVVESDGSSVIFGETLAPGARWSATAIRFDADGRRDRAWGRGGIVQVPFARGDLEHVEGGAAVARDGRLVGVVSADAQPTLVFRLTRRGRLDPSFRHSGRLILRRA